MKILIFFLFVSNFYSLIITYSLSPTNCPASCSCDLTSNTLTISSCTSAQLTFNLPTNFTTDAQLASVTSIVAKNCLIQSFPTNICSYSGITLLDLSYNQLKSLTNANFNCLASLTAVYLNYNNITVVDSSTFNNQANLRYLNLANNQISQIPQYLFYTHLVNLNYIDLSYNQLTTMELWPTYLSKIININLKYNQISQFTNNFLWFLAYSNNLPALPSSSTVDLQYNKFTTFDDKSIQQYGVCSYSDYTTFVKNYLSIFWLNNNPITCNCANSQRLVIDSIYLLANNTNLMFSNLYDSYCTQSSVYLSKHILNFDVCISNSIYSYCKNSTFERTTTSTTISITNKTITTINRSLQISAALYKYKFIILFNCWLQK